MRARKELVFILAGVLTMSLISLWVIRHRDPVAAFVADFDANLQGAPLAAEAARDDPRLRDKLLEQSKAAFVRAGWPAANMAIRLVLASEIEPYADDTHILAMERANLSVLLALESTPSLCKVYALAGSTSQIEAVAKREVAALSAAHWEDVQNGTIRKRSGVEWHTPEYGERVAASLQIKNGANSLSNEEARAYERSGTRDPVAVTVDPTALCHARVAIARNILALPAAEGARIGRILISNVTNIDWLSRLAAMRRDDTNAPTNRDRVNER